MLSEYYILDIIHIFNYSNASLVKQYFLSNIFLQEFCVIKSLILQQQIYHLFDFLFPKLCQFSCLRLASF